MLTNSIGMKFAIIPPGEFQMGSPKELIDEKLRTKELLHAVRITHPFWLGATEVTQADYDRVMGSNPSKFQGDPKRPVEHVSWDDAAEFCRRLSAIPAERMAKRRYQLPTEVAMGVCVPCGYRYAVLLRRL